MPDERPRPLDDEGVVQEKQGLLRHGGRVALRRVCVRIREIELAHHRGNEFAVDVTIDGTAAVEFALRGGALECQVARGTAEARIEFAGGGEELVAQSLEVEPLAREVAEEAVVGIEGGGGGRVFSVQ